MTISQSFGSTLLMDRCEAPILGLTVALPSLTTVKLTCKFFRLSFTEDRLRNGNTRPQCNLPRFSLAVVAALSNENTGEQG